MIATISEIKKKFSNRSDHSDDILIGNHFLAIAATTIAEIELFLSQRSLSLRTLRSLRSLESGFHMIAMIAELFLFSAIVEIIWKPGFR